jgi:hypothetical protein
LYISYRLLVDIDPQHSSVGVPTDLPLSSTIKVMGRFWDAAYKIDSCDIPVLKPMSPKKQYTLFVLCCFFKAIAVPTDIGDIPPTIAEL